MDQTRLQAFGNHRIHRFDADVFEIGAGGVEMAVIRYQVAFLAGRQNSTFSAARPWCVGTKYLIPVILRMTASPIESCAPA